MSVEKMALEAKTASVHLAMTDTETKNKAIIAIVEGLIAHEDAILKANASDVGRSESEGLDLPLLKRLKLDHEKLMGVAQGLKDLVALKDPVGAVTLKRELDAGLNLYQVTCPIGVIGVIFESRPDALVQIASLCLKSGNSVLLKGGSEALLTNRILFEVIEEAAYTAGLPKGWIQLIETREDVNAMLALDASIDLIIPRGSNAFVNYIMNHSNIPVLGHADGICHTYVDKAADLEKAVQIALDAKTQYVAVCNATECLLVHEAVAETFLPGMKAAFDAKQVVIYGCEKTQSVIACEPATKDSYKTEYLDYAITIKVVPDLEAAITHINAYGSGHTDAILTNDTQAAKRFMALVDAGNVFVNCSTRFADGLRYGFGAEVGVSTNKIHARGPVGLEGLVIYKYKLIGTGQTVAPYVNGTKTFTHQTIDVRDGDYL